MAKITAAMVKDLRETTGAGMMDCKQALTETNGDMEAAIDWLRKKGLSKAAKKAGRVAAEGLIGVVDRGHQGRRGRGQFRDRLRRAQRPVPGPGQDDRPGRARRRRRRRRRSRPPRSAAITVETAIADAIATIGENMTLRRAASLEVGKGVVGELRAQRVVDGLGKIGVLVALESTGKTDELAALGRQIAMHVAAANPLALDPSGLDPAVVKREKDVLADKYRQQGKPENVIEKIVEFGPEDLLQGSLPARAGLHPRRQEDRSPRR